jgi:hypothetical protein
LAVKEAHKMLGMGYLKSRPQGHHASSVLPETTRVSSLHHFGVGDEHSDHDEKKEHAQFAASVKSPRSPIPMHPPTPIGSAGGGGGHGAGKAARRHAFLATLFLAILAVENTASMLGRVGTFPLTLCMLALFHSLKHRLTTASTVWSV